MKTRTGLKRPHVLEVKHVGVGSIACEGYHPLAMDTNGMVWDWARGHFGHSVG